MMGGVMLDVIVSGICRLSSEVISSPHCSNSSCIRWLEPAIDVSVHLAGSGTTMSDIHRKLPLKTRISIHLSGALTDASQRSDGTLNRRLLSFLDFRTPAKRSPDSTGVRSTDVTVDSARDLWVRVFTPPASAESPPVVVFFHGGGFAYLSASSPAYDAVCRRISRYLDAIVVSVNYRLSPENRFPAPYEDGESVLRFIDDANSLSAVDIVAAANLAPDLSSLFLVGDSAGANIVHHVACRFLTKQGTFSNIRIAGTVSIQPFFGGEERTEAELRLEGAPIVSVRRVDWLWKAFLPDGADRNHEAANVTSPEAEQTLPPGFPPTLVVVGGHDPLQDWQRKYHEMLSRKATAATLAYYPTAIHAFYVFPELEEGGKLMEEMKRFVAVHRRKQP